MARPRQHAPDALHAQVMHACDEWLAEQPVHGLSLRAAGSSSSLLLLQLCLAAS